MSDHYPVRPVTITGDKYPTAAELDHQRWMNRPHVEVVENGPRVISVRPPPTASELDAARRERRRPADKSARAISVALANVQSDTIMATAAVAGLQDQAESLLVNGGSVEAIKAIRAKLEDAQIGLDQLYAMEASLKTSLARAEEQEAEARAELAALVPAALAIVTAFRKSIEVDLPKHAKAIAAIIAQETAAEAAMATLRSAANQLPGHDSPDALPLAPYGKAWRISITLPGYVAPPPPYQGMYGAIG